MYFSKIVDRYLEMDFEKLFAEVSSADVAATLAKIGKSRLEQRDLLNLLSPASDEFFSQIASASMRMTKQYFGNAMSLYMPIYISNFCQNRCLYCGFNHENKIIRKHLSLDEIEEEAREISKTEVKHILLLTGEAPKLASYEYVRDSVEILKRHFESVSVEVYPMSVAQYSGLKRAGVDGVTVYQECYDKEVYSRMHPSGPKRDYDFRIDTPDRAAEANMRWVSTGPLYGLADPLKEAFISGVHSRYLIDKYLDTEFSVSVPRLNPAEGCIDTGYKMENRLFFKVIFAMRLYNPRIGINLSTRESAGIRDSLLGLGITRLSAGSKTDVGGYQSKDKSTAQFEISDSRSVAEVMEMMKSRGFQPVHKDWDLLVEEEFCI
ncbi:MAG: 2-iminoacetate synthase ThiH [Spirochaetales bacterium]|nr:2-iminoacetate synthase ThiH [Spirochaetales bacterium]